MHWRQPIRSIPLTWPVLLVADVRRGSSPIASHLADNNVDATVPDLVFAVCVPKLVEFFTVSQDSFDPFFEQVHCVPFLLIFKSHRTGDRERTKVRNVDNRNHGFSS